MTARHEELLQARVDGELTSDQRLELERLFAEDASTQLRAGELDALAQALNLLGPEDPPARVLRAVIDHVHHNAPGALNDSQTTATGSSMRTKVLWGLAAAAGIVLAVLAYTGFPPETGGSEGAIGAATRYQAGQIAASEVKLGDQAAQEFLQSDLFDRLRKDEAVVAVLSNPAIGRALADPALARAFSDPALVKALKEPGLVKALSDEDLVKALTNADLVKALTDADLVKALRDPSLAKALSSADLQQALKSNGLSAALKSPQFGEAMRVAR